MDESGDLGELLPHPPPAPLPEDQRLAEIAELVTRYRAVLNEMVGRMLFYEREVRRGSDVVGDTVGGFVDAFLQDVSRVPIEAEQWKGEKCYAVGDIYGKIWRMYHAARDLRITAKKIVTVRRNFYRDLCTLWSRHQMGESGFDVAANLRAFQRRRWSDADRKAVWERSGGRCKYCNRMLATWSGADMHIDHVRRPAVGILPECNICAVARSDGVGEDVCWGVGVGSAWRSVSWTMPHVSTRICWGRARGG